jgi:phosphatidate cytidylyltransferase
MSFCAQLRLLGGPIDGLIALAALVIVVKMGDTGAYTVGRLFGRHKMAPVLSPGKTWEGLFGGLVFAVVGSWVAFHLLPRSMGHTLAQTTWSWLVFGLVVGGTGIVGDLAESLFKRDVGRKDSSTWMPGFGGILDVLDSILFAAPAAYACWYAGSL